MLTAVSLFAGIGGFDLALQRAGVDVAAAVEIDPAARGVLADHFPHTALFDDVREVSADDLRAAGFVPERGILTAGFPCQDLSISGRRGGLGRGTRSGLFWEIDRLVAELAPRWVVLENVPGLLSTVCPCTGDGACVERGRAAECEGEPHHVKGGTCPGGCLPTHGGAMGAVLGCLGHRGYGFAYRVLDAAGFGVAQRRRRVLIVGNSRDWAAPAQVLLEPESRAGDPAARGAAEPDVAGTLGSRVGGSRTTDLDGHGAYVAGTLGGGSGERGWAQDTERMTFLPVTARALMASGDGNKFDDTYESEDGTGRGTPMVPYSLAVGKDYSTGEDVAQTVRGANGQPGTVALPSAVAEAVRRLTPTECERLQGFPDGWTATSAGQPQSDSARYRQLGNAVAVPCAAWVVRRLIATQQA